jgi:hypothetical protein
MASGLPFWAALFFCTNLFALPFQPRGNWLTSRLINRGQVIWICARF